MHCNNIKLFLCTPWHRVFPKLAEKTVKSVFDQTYTNFKWTIIDNSDETSVKEYFEEFFKSHPEYDKFKSQINIIPIKYTSKTPFNPCGVYKNLAINLSGAHDDDYIVMLDYDDYLDSTTFENIVKLLDEEPYLEYISSEKILLETYDAENDMITDTKIYNYPNFVFAYDYVNNSTYFQIPVSFMCFKYRPFRDLIGGFNESADYSDDFIINKCLYMLRSKKLSGIYLHYTYFTDKRNYSAKFGENINRRQNDINLMHSHYIPLYREYIKNHFGINKIFCIE